MPEAHNAPGFATLAGLCLYAAEDPVDIRSLGTRRAAAYRSAVRQSGWIEQLRRLMRGLRENF
jgi:cell division protein FtsA